MTRAILRWTIRTTIFTLIIAACLIALSGQRDWTIAWVYAGLFLAAQIINLITILLTSPDLLVERADMQEGTKEWDRPLALFVSFLGPLAIWIAAGLDRRFGWSGSSLLWSQVVGLIVVGLGSLLTIWAMAVNRFFASTVRLQPERGHKVISGGPYRFVRHPGYLGGVLFDLGTPFALGTYWALLPAILTMYILALRTAREDSTLLEELQGYDRYTKEVRYRLLPLIW